MVGASRETVGNRRGNNRQKMKAIDQAGGDASIVGSLDEFIKLTNE